MWKRGDQIVFRYLEGDRISFAMPVIVVEDSPEVVALYAAVDTPVKLQVHLDGSAISRSLPYEEQHILQWRLGDGVWRDNSVLMGAAHVFAAMWRGRDWSFVGWYVNLQAPLSRTTMGFDSEDHELDVVVGPDLTWRWKDEDELAEAVRLGRFTSLQAAKIRAEGEAAIRAVEARAWPLDGGWEAWRPDPAWPIPWLPEGWDEA